MKRILLSLLICLGIQSVFAQLYSEDFSSYTDGTGYEGSSSGPVAIGDYPGGTNWTIDTTGTKLIGNTDYAKTRSERFEIRDSDGPIVWTSPAIGISGHTEVDFSVTVGETGDLEASNDFVLVEYSTDSGSTFTKILDWNGHGNTQYTFIGDHPDDADWQLDTVTQSGLSGTYFILRVTMQNGASSEFIYIDDILLNSSGGSGDTDAPTASKFSPTDDSVQVNPSSNLVVTFNENIKAGTGNIIISDYTSVAHTIAIDSSAISISDSVLSINPPSNLAIGTWYFVNIDSGAVLDIAGNAFLGIGDTTTWNFKTDTISVPAVVSMSPADDATGVSISSSFDLVFDQPVTKGTGTIYIVRTSSSVPVDTTSIDVASGQVTVSDSLVTIDPSSDLMYDSEYYITVDSASFESASEGVFIGITAGTVWSFTTSSAPTLISAIQGAGSENAMDNATVTVEAIVVGDFQNGDTDETRNLRGFYVQEEDADADGNVATSEGVFVFENGNFITDVKVGDKVLISGTVDEYFGETQLDNITSITVVSTGNTLPTAASISYPFDSVMTDQAGDIIANLEAFEGMRVNFSQKLTINEMFQLDRFGEIKLVQGDRPYQFTQKNAPGVAGYAAHLDEVGARTITYDDGLNSQNNSISDLDGFGPTFNTSSDIRMGDQITNLSGILSYQWAGNSSSQATWRVRAATNGENTFSKVSSRQSAPESVSGSLKVAGLNVLNYFKTLDNGSKSANGDDPRGANDSAEFARQTQKLVTTLIAMDADVYGLVELENDFSSSSSGNAIKFLVETMNDTLGTDRYNWVDPGTQFVGDDVIAVGVIYDSTKVSIPVGTTIEILDDSDLTGLGLPTDTAIFNGASTNRSPLAVTFEEKANGEEFSVVVCHMKSKGSAGTFNDADKNDGVGSANITRLRGVEALDLWIDSDPTGSNDSDVVILGDFNAYAKEEPIEKMETEGYVDIIADRLGGDLHSFVFDGQIGTLDYAFTTSTLAVQTTGVTEWAINSDEPDAIDYNTDNSRDTDMFDGTVPYRTSDHDPVIIGLQLGKIYQNGTWLSGAPSDSSYTYILSDYDSVAFPTKDLMIDSAVNVKITPNSHGNLVINGDFENKGFLGLPSAVSLVNFGTVTGKGTFAIERKTSHDTLTGKYSFVGSPVETSLVDSLGRVVYEYDETVPFDVGGADGLNNYKSVTEDTMIVGKGYASAFTGTIIFAGKPNTGNISAQVSKTDYPSADDSQEGFNMVANPYPCAINFNKFIMANMYDKNSNPGGVLEGTIWIWDDNKSNLARGTSSDFLTINTVGIVGGSPKNNKKWGSHLGLAQGFFVKVSDTIAVSYGNHHIHFADSMKVKGYNADSSFFRKSTDPIERVRINLVGEEAYDETLIGFVANATTGMDVLYDATKIDFKGGSRIFTMVNDKALAIQGLPLAGAHKVSLGISIANTGTYVINFDQFDFRNKKTWLQDAKTGQLIEVHAGSAYSFQAGKGVDRDRFSVIFSNGDVSASPVSLYANIFVNANHELQVNVSEDLENFDLQVYDLLGNQFLMLDNQSTMGRLWTKSANSLSKGIYVIRIQSKGLDYRKKIIIQ